MKPFEVLSPAPVPEYKVLIFFQFFKIGIQFRLNGSLSEQPCAEGVDGTCKKKLEPGKRGFITITYLVILLFFVRLLQYNLKSAS